MSHDMTSGDLNLVVFKWLRLVTGFADSNIIEANQNGFTPEGDYATYNFISDLSEPLAFKQRDRILPADLDVEAQYSTRDENLVDINIYSAMGKQILKKLRLSNNLLIVRVLLRENNTGLMGGVGTAQNLNFIDDTSFKPRWQQAFEFVNWNNSKEQYEQIKEFEIKGTFEIPNGS